MALTLKDSEERTLMVRMRALLASLADEWDPMANGGELTSTQPVSKDLLKEAQALSNEFERFQ